MNILDVLKLFFTHKDFLPPADQLPGTLFTPLHIVFAVLLTVCTVLLTKWLSKKSESLIRKVFFGIWVWMVLSEAAVILWETYCGADVWFELTGNLPLYPCSVFLYAMPMVLWGKGWLREAGCGYICTVGLVGGLINFVYPANVLGTYSCLSFAGMRSLLYHGSMVLCALVLLVSGLHSFRWKGTELAAAERQKGAAASNSGAAAKQQNGAAASNLRAAARQPQNAAASNLRAAAGPKLWHLLVPAIPCLLVSIPANLVNFVLVPNADYMFFKLESFFLAPLGAVLPKWFTVLIMYIVYLAASTGPYLPGWLKAQKERV
ncbi:MAG: hypothetical protein E7223_03935 [Clostridiales bacterium]|nr:hypothetical protein [Clostridiales bacterium]